MTSPLTGRTAIPLKLSVATARRRFREALLRASGGDVPSEWMGIVTQLGEGPQAPKTFIAFLGTAMLAKATDPRVDVFAVKERAGPAAYAARSFCSTVLVPLAMEAGIDLGVGGDDPLANQPFFPIARVDADFSVRSPRHGALLRRALAELARVDSEGALAALAAFLLVRRRRPVAQLKLPEAVLSLDEIAEAAKRFIEEDPEEGRRGQALAAAALDLVFANGEVRTAPVHDPSRERAGDVQVSYRGHVILAAEVRQKQLTDDQVRVFVARLARDGIGRGVVVALARRQPELDARRLREDARRNHDVHLEVMQGVAELLRASVLWSREPIATALSRFPQLMADRLKELGVAAESLEKWAQILVRVR